MHQPPTFVSVPLATKQRCMDLLVRRVRATQAIVALAVVLFVLNIWVFSVEATADVTVARLTIACLNCVMTGLCVAADYRFHAPLLSALRYAGVEVPGFAAWPEIGRLAAMFSVGVLATHAYALNAAFPPGQVFMLQTMLGLAMLAAVGAYVAQGRRIGPPLLALMRCPT